MFYRFAGFELEPAKAEMRKDGATVGLEPQVLALIVYLLENRERLVTKEELVETIWDGRVISDAAIAGRVKAARRAVGDDGAAQRVIRTVHGRGFRFVAAVDVETAARSTGLVPDSGLAAPAPAQQRPSIAVLPFRLLGVHDEMMSVLADAFAHDLIAALCRLRWLFVIARGSSFRFRDPDTDVRTVGHALAVRYCVTGTMEFSGPRLRLTVELADTRDGGVVWSEHYDVALTDIHEVRDTIVQRVVNALELAVPDHEARLARLVAPGALDAWSAFHLGLQHMHRFNRADNERAVEYFSRAVHIDSEFARGHAGLSAARFQNAFLRYTGDPAGEARAAKRAAERALQLDADDAFSNFVMGRSGWLAGDIEGSLPWLERATLLSPSYAQGIYARAWARTVSGQAATGLSDAELAHALSPLDPFAYAMLGTRALAHLALGEDAVAAELADRAARTPGAHVLIALIAVIALSLAGQDQRAAGWAASARERRPDLAAEDFFRAFPFSDDALRQRMAVALARHGL